MIESIEFTNFKALRKTTLPLAPFTLLLGPNGSGKTSVLQALRRVAVLASRPVDGSGQILNEPQIGPSLRSVTAKQDAFVEVKLGLRLQNQCYQAMFHWPAAAGHVTRRLLYDDGKAVPQPEAKHPLDWLSRMRDFALDAAVIAMPSQVNGGPLNANGSGLVAILDDLKDNQPERWDSLLAEMRRWLPEYDYIMFDKPNPGQKAIALRTKKGGHRIPAVELSQGTLVALALLTLAYSPNPPSLVGLEEIDRGLHPRLLRHLQDALYRLSYPESCGEARPPIQVLATTHSPYLLDLYREHPEEVVIAQKEGLEVTMRRLTDIEHYQEIVEGSLLSEVWYSGVLGGVSVKP